MKWLTIKLMKLQLKKANKQLKNEDVEPMIIIYNHMIENYKRTITCLESFKSF